MWYPLVNIPKYHHRIRCCLACTCKNHVWKSVVNFRFRYHVHINFTFSSVNSLIELILICTKMRRLKFFILRLFMSCQIGILFENSYYQHKKQSPHTYVYLRSQDGFVYLVLFNQMTLSNILQNYHVIFQSFSCISAIYCSWNVCFLVLITRVWSMNWILAFSRNILNSVYFNHFFIHSGFIFWGASVSILTSFLIWAICYAYNMPNIIESVVMVMT